MTRITLLTRLTLATTTAAQAFLIHAGADKAQAVLQTSAVAAARTQCHFKVHLLVDLITVSIASLKTYMRIKCFLIVNLVEVLHVILGVSLLWKTGYKRSGKC